MNHVHSWSFRLVVLAALSAQAILASAQPVLYVDLAATGSGDGTTWSDAFTSLQDALKAANSGAEIWIAAGIYRPDEGEGIDPGDADASFVLIKSVSLVGGFLGGEAYRDERDFEANQTILSGDLQSNDDPDQVRWWRVSGAENSINVLKVYPGEDETSPVLDGLTIRGGLARTTAVWGVGGGVFVESGASLRVQNTVFEYNMAQEYGGAIGSYGSISVRKSIFYKNRAGMSRASGGGDGGAIFSGWLPTDPQVIDSTVFDSNFSEDCGGAITTYFRRLIVTNSQFINNFSEYGGGAICDHYGQDSGSIYANSQFLGNTAARRTNTYPVYAGALWIEDHAATVYNTIFSGNRAQNPDGSGVGGSIAVTGDYDRLIVVNADFVTNYSMQGSAIYSDGNGAVDFSNSIAWTDDQSSGAQLEASSGTAHSVRSSIVLGGVPFNFMDGGGNQSLDPLLADANGLDDIPGTPDDNVRLSFGSPAIDAGNNSLLPFDTEDLDEDGRISEPLPVDADFRQRVFSGTGGTPIVDIGAFEFGAPPINLALEEFAEAGSDHTLLQGNYPNPFRDKTVISYSVPIAGEVRLEVFDLLGRRVQILKHGFLAAGSFNQVFTASALPTGVYICVLTAGDWSQSRSMVLTK